MRILVIEDHPDLAANLGDYLETRGHSVDFAADGVDGLRLASKPGYDVIILDRMLPRLDGATVCKRLRQEYGCSTPVLMLTAMDSIDDRVAGLECGADDYLIKPFALSELRARIEALHRRASGEVGVRMLQVDDLRYDLQTLEATRAGQALTLYPTTRRILEHLMRNTHRVVPRAELEQVVWDDDVPLGDVLRAHIHNLRNTLDKPFERKLLHTVHGIGFRLSEPDNG